MFKYLVFVGALANLVGGISYIKGMFLRDIKPNKITWLIWSISPLIATFATISAGFTLSVIPVFMSGFIPLVIFIISFIHKGSYWKISKFDICCGLLSVVALIIWYITDNPNYAIVLSILSNLLATIPTIIKGFKYPKSENAFSYFLGFLSAITSFFAIKNWDFLSLAFPIYLIISNLSLTLIIKIKNDIL